jgi:hypothetical protein
MHGKAGIFLIFFVLQKCVNVTQFCHDRLTHFLCVFKHSCFKLKISSKYR